jgi:N-hydroxyarylamine O-acetyltransferase
MDVDRYLARIGFDEPVRTDLPTLEGLMRAHLSTVPFENLDVFNGVAVRTDTGWSLPKVVDRRRGGWCFELNGAFALLLEHLGFQVARLGAAVLLGGPKTVIDHLTLEVRLERPYLVDVGFGDSFCRPLALDRRGPQDGGTATFELMGSPQGTTLVRTVEGAPVAQYRFKRVTLQLPDFDAASRRLRTTPNPNWHRRAFATRYLDGGPDRVTLIGNELKVERGERVELHRIADEGWSDTLEEWFGVRVELATPADRHSPEPLRAEV